MKARRLRLAVLASGEGTTLEAIASASGSGSLAADVVLVMSNNRDSGALRRARDRGIPAAHLSGTTHPAPDDLDRAMLDVLVGADVELIVLAGFLKKIGPRVLAAFEGRIINTHPALLPKFGGRGMYGRRVHEAVLAAGEEVSGVTIHLVTAGYDEGPVIGRAEVPVLPTDTVETLAGRVQAEEKALLVRTIHEWARTRRAAAPDGVPARGV
ncbi:MAG: Phosphoribosylglycinamide formyltransferase [Gammaproteobacteria bacterium]|nr:Phosphoribosylglycinamide formyltransferase [Gammaproteobacteria bacterium]